MKLEICVDNHESLLTAVRNGADRIELCASLREGGLTPPASFIGAALRTGAPIMVMVRPRSCDFLYSGAEIEMMHADVRLAREMGAAGVVLGVLTAEGEVDREAMRSLVDEAGGIEVAFHRAIDQARDVEGALEALVALGVRRVLSSGQAEAAPAGVEALARMAAWARGRVEVMAGGGITPDNAREVAARSGVDALHASARHARPSAMRWQPVGARMGAGRDYWLDVADGETVRRLKAAVAAVLAEREGRGA